MISSKTTFILGAGASKPYGFPLGNELVNRICSELTFDISKLNSISLAAGIYINQDVSTINFFTAYRLSHLARILISLGYHPQEIDNFRKRLQLSLTPSIDTFLEINKDLTDIGKICISYVLLLCESQSRSIFFDDSVNDHWYKYIWHKISTPDFNELDGNNVSFITFNYDRSLEYFLVIVCSAMYNRSKDECWEKIKKFNFIHLHGSLGYLKWQSTSDSDEYGLNFNIPKVNSDSAKFINTIYENHLPKSSSFSEACDVLKNSNLIYSMGFGFNAQNIERLKLNEPPKNRVLCSRTGLTDNEARLVQNSYPSLHLVDRSDSQYWGCVEFLRNVVVLK